MAFVLVLILGAAMLLLTRAWFDEAASTRRRLRRATPAAIAAFPDAGYRRIRGELALADRHLEAPLSGRRCAAYEVVIEQRAPADNGWIVLDREVRVVPFTLTDASGRAVVESTGAYVAIVRDWHARCANLRDASAAHKALLARLHLTPGPDADALALRFSEGVLAPGEMVTVLGRGSTASARETTATPHDGGYRAPAERVAVTLRDYHDAPLFISDDPRVLGRPDSAARSLPPREGDA
jgi:hypothetical protein